jgi:hypothetical protein
MVLKITKKDGKSATVRLQELDMSNMTVLEAAELARMLEDKWGVSAAAAVALRSAPTKAKRNLGVAANPRPRSLEDARVRIVTVLKRHSSDLRDVFLRRTLGALERISENITEQTLIHALAAPTDLGGLARVIGDATIVDDATRKLDPLATALARDAEQRETLLARSAGVLSAEEVGRILGITRQAVDKRRVNRRLLAVKQAGDWRYPGFQFADGGPCDAMKAVIEILDDPTGWSTLAFLLTPDSVLEERTPSEALNLGPDWSLRVLRLARAQKGDGFS